MRDVAFSDDDAPHRLGFEVAGERREVTCRWAVDACGRAGLIKRKLGLAQPNAHHANAVWFRIKDRIDIDRWSDNIAWREATDAGFELRSCTPLKKSCIAGDRPEVVSASRLSTWLICE